MSTLTKNYGLNKPDKTDTYDITVPNDNMDKIDTALHELSTSKAEQTAVDDLKKSVSDGKTLVANAITGKGQATATDATFATMASNIGNIKTGIDTSGATATANDILSGRTAGVGDAIITGVMPDNGAVSQALNAGGSYTIPTGYHNGSGKITANSLASQTPGTATNAQILNGQTAWVNGELRTGNIPVKSEYTSFVSVTGGRSAATDAVYMRIPQGAYLASTSAGYPEITMTLADFLNGTGIYDRGVYSGGCSSATPYDNKIYLRIPQGYYHGGSYDTNGGEAEVYIPYADLASLLGITAEKLVAENTICGVAGTASSIQAASGTATSFGLTSSLGMQAYYGANGGGTQVTSFGAVDITMGFVPNLVIMKNLGTTGESVNRNSIAVYSTLFNPFSGYEGIITMGYYGDLGAICITTTNQNSSSPFYWGTTCRFAVSQYNYTGESVQWYAFRI